MRNFSVFIICLGVFNNFFWFGFFFSFINKVFIVCIILVFVIEVWYFVFKLLGEIKFGIVGKFIVERF